MDKKDVDLAEAYTYTVGDIEMFEFHVDSSKELIDFVPQEMQKFGGNLSVRKPQNEKPLIRIGQDEAIFHQFQLGRKTWILANGQKRIDPKNDGDGIMVSAFNSRVFGFGMLIDDIDWPKVNQNRSGKRYADEEAATEVLGNASKCDLSRDNNPFVKTFGVGVNFDGYWNHHQMSVQFEDVHDIVSIMYPNADVEYYFDHSSCHDKLRENGLNAKDMNREYGGAQRCMRDSTITNGCLGQHNPKLAVGDIQRMVFTEDDVGPFWMTPEQRELTKYDRPTGASKTFNKKRSELIRDLKRADVELPRRRFLIADLRTFAAQHGIATTYDQQLKEEGWVNKPKGLLQVLWERGFIDSSIPLKSYTIQGPKKDDGERDKTKSLEHLMAECNDFKDEYTALQFHAQQLGTTIICTPKYHAEIAGEGIEYCWGLAKNWFKRLPLKERKTRAQFESRVNEAISHSVVSVKRARGSARRQRSYVLAYMHLHRGESAGESPQCSKEFVDIEKMAKTCHTHRGASDLDSAYIRQLENE